MIQAAETIVASQSNGQQASTSHPPGKHLDAKSDKHFVSLYQRLLVHRTGPAPARRAIGVTSSLPGEGVSTVAVELAACAAQLGGEPVLLVDANLHRPSAARIFGLGAEPGLFEVLMGTISARDCIRPSKCDRLSVMTSGCWTAGVEPLYVPTAIAALVSELRSNYTTIVFDLPAAEECSPAGLIGGALDGVLLVVEAARIQDELARRAVLRLQRANVVLLGVVLNKHK